MFKEIIIRHDVKTSIDKNELFDKVKNGQIKMRDVYELNHEGKLSSEDIDEILEYIGNNSSVVDII